MIYSQFALFMLRVFGMVHQAAFKFYSTNSTANSGSMRTARIEGDIYIGALFPVHRKQNGSDSCGDIWEQYGIHRTEVALLTIDEINKRKIIAPRVKLGIDIRDDCWTERKAMEQSIEFIRDTMGQKPTATQCCLGLAANDERCHTSSSFGHVNGSGNTMTPNLAAVVGPGSSDPSIAVQNLMQVFRIPQVGYSATTVDLSDKIEFKYYMRVAPSDIWQAKALYDIVRHFNWTYIAAVYSAVNYGEKGFQEFSKNVEKDDSGSLCIAVQEKIKSLSPPEDYDRLLDTIINANPRPQVAVCFCEGQTMTEIFKATKRLKERNLDEKNITDTNIQWIGSDGWSDRRDVVAGVEDYARGQMSLKIYSKHPAQIFDDHYLNLKPNNNLQNPWFEDFWEEKFKCSLRDSTKRLYSKICHGNESLRENYEPDPKLSQVINSIYTVAYALSAMYNDTCGNLNYTNEEDSGRLCAQMKPINGSELFQYMLRVRFEDLSGQEIYFDSNGDPPARYEILNYHGRYAGYKSVGEWKRVENKHNQINNNWTEKIDYEIILNINRDDLVWSNGRSAIDYVPISVCSPDCKASQFKQFSGQQKCCWTCGGCKDYQFLSQNQTCENCTLGWWPTDDHLDCYELEVEYFRWNSPEAIAAMVLAFIGIVTSLYATVLFMRYNSTPVVKATTRELSYIILVGFLMCYSTTFLIVIKPNNVTCYFLRIVPGTAFAMIYGALLTKTNRIARILAGSKKRILTKKPRFMSTLAQLMITLMLVAVELAIIAAILIYEPPSAVHDYSIPRRNLLICETTTLSFLAPFGFDFFLISLCTLYAVKTRNLPENFNEAKFIGFTMYTTCIIWLAFCTIYFGSNNKGITMCLSFSLSATVGLVLLFFPKMYIIVFQPEKNVRSSYATTKVIRCHFGTSPSQQSSANQSQSNRTSSSVKTSSRPSSKYSTSRSGTDSGIETSMKLRKNFLRESVHVTVPPNSGGAVKTKIEVSNVVGAIDLLSKKFDEVGSPKMTTGGGLSSKSSSFRGQVYFRPEFENELSVIEESLLSHDDSTATQSQGPPTSAPGSVDQPAPTYNNESSQTDVELLEEYLRAWWDEKPLKQNVPVGPRRSLSQKQQSASSLLDRKKQNLLSVEAQPSRKSSSGINLKRTLSEYKHNLKKKILTRSKERIEHEPSLDLNTDDPFEAMLAYRLSHLEDARSGGSSSKHSVRHNADESPLLRPEQDHSDKSKKYGLKPPGGNLMDIGDDGDDAEKRKKVSSASSLGDLLAQGLGGSLQTMFGTGLPANEDQEFYITTVVDFVGENENETNAPPRSLIGESLESSFGALAVSLCPTQKLNDQPRLSVEGSRSGSDCSTLSQSRHSPPKHDGKSSFLSRLGFSLRKKMRRFSHESVHNDDHSPPNRRSRENVNDERSSSMVGQRLLLKATNSRAFSVDTATSAFGLIPEETETPTTSPYKMQSLSTTIRGESMESDSGIIVNKTFEKNISFDSTTGNKSEFDTDSSKHSSSKSKHDSLKKGHINKYAPTSSTTSPIMNFAIERKNMVIESPNSSSNGGGSTTIQDLEQVFYKQGLEPKGFSQSTLV